MILKTNSNSACMEFCFTLERLFGAGFFCEDNNTENGVFTYLIGRDRLIERFSKVKKVLIVGLNPSKLSPDESALHPQTKCRKKVDSWFEDTSEKYFLDYINLSDIKSKNLNEIKKNIKSNQLRNRALLRNTYGDHAVVALGEVVSDFLDEYGVDHYPMPHPSGLNRFWNDVDASKEAIKTMLRWISI